MTSGKFAPLKRKRDWVGRRVRLRGGATTRGGDRYLPGTVFIVDFVSNSTYGYWLRFPTCKHCGHSGVIRISDASELELLLEEESDA